MQTSNVNTTLELFSACRGARSCEECTGAYYSEDGERHKCSHRCHVQGALFGMRLSKQTGFNFPKRED